MDESYRVESIVDPMQVRDMYAQQLVRHRIVAIATMLSDVPYIAVGYVLNTIGFDFAMPGNQSLGKLLMMLLVGCGFGVGIFSFSFKSTMIHKQKAQVKTTGDILTLYVRSTIVAMAMASSAGVNGLILFLLFGDFKILVFMCCLSVAFKSQHFPRVESLLQLTQRIVEERNTSGQTAV